jgi:microcompartment protein CcmK/EutM
MMKPSKTYSGSFGPNRLAHLKHSSPEIVKLPMLIAKVVGSAVATIKDKNLTGVKLLIVREADINGQPTGKPLVAIDTVNAGQADLVLIAAGSSARQTEFTKDRPVDAVIMAVLDSLEVDGKVTYRKS